ncbi:MAG: helicase associated domain-containing protein [Bacteroidota bacterium]|nr:helicase associated domain-containing protein [Bacteroidota bacterium]
MEEVQSYIKEHGHLPNIPSAQEMEENGIQLGEMNMKLLEKIEELTLYTLRQEEKIERLEALNKRIDLLEKNYEKLLKEMKNEKK